MLWIILAPRRLLRRLLISLLFHPVYKTCIIWQCHMYPPTCKQYNIILYTTSDIKDTHTHTHDTCVGGPCNNDDSTRPRHTISITLARAKGTYCVVGPRRYYVYWVVRSRDGGICSVYTTIYTPSYLCTRTCIHNDITSVTSDIVSKLLHCVI